MIDIEQIKDKSYLVIANELFFAKAKMKLHIKNIYQILQVTNKAGAVRDRFL